MAIFALATLAGAAKTPRAISRLALLDNGRAAGSVNVVHDSDGLLVALEPLLDRLRIAHRRAGNVRIIVADDLDLELTPGSRVVHDDGGEAMRFAVTPVERSGVMYVAPHDLATLLGADIQLHGSSLDVSQPAKKTSLTVTERPAVRGRHAPDTRYASSVKPAPARTQAPVAFAGRIGVTLLDSGGQRSQSLVLQGSSDTVRGALNAQGADGTPNRLDGTLIFGDEHRSAVVGGVADPLTGSVFQASFAEGIALTRAAGQRQTFFDALRSDGTRVYAFEQQRRSVTSEVALTTKAGAFDQVLYGQRQHRNIPGLILDTEEWIGSHGLAAGATATTTGRLFLRSSFAVAGAGLPLKVGDEPREVSVGYHATRSLTLLSGIYSAQGIPQSRFVAATVRTGSISLGISKASLESEVSLDVAGRDRSLSLTWFHSLGASSRALHAAAALHRGAVEIAAQTQSDRSGEASVVWRATRSGPSFLAGLDRIWAQTSGRTGIVAGVAVPISAGLSLEGSLRPLTRSNGVRFSIVQDVILHRRVKSQRRALHVLAAVGPLGVFVDGVRAGRIDGAGGVIDVPEGSATIFVRSSDGLYGSPTISLADRGTGALDIPIWPVHVVRGRVVVDNPNPVDAQLSLAHTVVALEPGELVTEVQKDGSFAMPAQPIPPDAMLRIDPATLPEAFAPGAAMPVSTDGETVLHVISKRRTERRIFLNH